MLKNKNILIILLLFIFLLVISTSCFAFSNEDCSTCFNLVQTYLDNNNIEYYDYLITNEDNILRVYVFISPDYSCFVGDFQGSTYIHANNYIIFNFENENTTEFSSIVNYDGSGNTYALTLPFIVYSSFDVLNYDGTIFFLATPCLQGVLAPIVAQVETEKTLQEIILILPLILVVVVSLVGLRKALQMLSTLLHRCLII